MIMLKLNRTPLVLSLAAWFGMLQFLVCLLLSVQLYGAGDAVKAYRLGSNFLSDLGRTAVLSGAPNPSCLLFNLSVIVLGVTLLAFFVFVPSGSDAGQAVVRVSGMLSSLGLIGIGATPYDRWYVAHCCALALWLGPLLVVVIAYLITSALRETQSAATRWYARGVVLAVLGYCLAGNHGGYVVMQKITAGMATLWFLAIASPFSPVYRTTFRYDSQARLLAEQQADR
jgi:hypothetical membrane protein